VQYFNQIGSTNDFALTWANQGAPDMALVVADEQTAGRGRAGRRWFTPPGSALALSLVMRPGSRENFHIIQRLSPLGALAVVDAIAAISAQETKIKWPNDVLIKGQKVAGILGEAHWIGESLTALILGIGINIAPAAIPDADQLDFPAASLEEALNCQVDRLQLLKEVLCALLNWRPEMPTERFLEAWEARLAYKGDQVVVQNENGPAVAGIMLGLTGQGNLRLEESGGNVIEIHAGEVRLRPVDIPGE
jgi:BirA family biotin operon repressor/biotin-[acetyl-CoA-carboxylase] ligase